MSTDLNTIMKPSDYDIIGNDDYKDGKYTEIINAYIDKPLDEQPLMFGIDLRGSVIRTLMNGTHETAPNIERANSLIIRLMGSMMARFTAMENAHVDDIHMIEPDIKNVIVFIDSIESLTSDDTIMRGIRCIRRIGSQAGYHVYIGTDSLNHLNNFINNKPLTENDSDNVNQNENNLITL